MLLCNFCNRFMTVRELDIKHLFLIINFDFIFAGKHNRADRKPAEYVRTLRIVTTIPRAKSVNALKKRGDGRARVAKNDYS